MEFTLRGLRSAKGQSSLSLIFFISVPKWSLVPPVPRESRKGGAPAREPPEYLWKLSRAGLPAGRFSPKLVGKRVPPPYKEIRFCGGRFQPGRKTEVPLGFWERTWGENAPFSRVQSPSECEAGPSLCLLKTQGSPMQANPSQRHHPASPFTLKAAAPSVGEAASLCDEERAFALGRMRFK